MKSIAHPDRQRLREDRENVLRAKEERDHLFPNPIPAPYELTQNCVIPPFFTHYFRRSHKQKLDNHRILEVLRCRRCANHFYVEIEFKQNEDGVIVPYKRIQKIVEAVPA